MSVKISAEALYKSLNSTIKNIKGNICFNFAGISVKINTTDIVGNILQAWLKQYLLQNNIYFSEPANTQEFPDFFLDNIAPHQHMLEVKAFNYNATPAFDIANFESYCDSVKENPFQLDADYLIFGYTMSNTGDIIIKGLWLHKIWEISGTSKRYPLKTQVKRDVIYNIRPNSNFKNGSSGSFKNKEDFLSAIFITLCDYRGKKVATYWLKTLLKNFKDYYDERATTDLLQTLHKKFQDHYNSPLIL